MHIAFWLENQKEKGHYERPTRKWENNIKIDIREMGWVSMDSTDLSHDRDQLRNLVNMAINFRIL
jgi:hypothetical protein